jgi:valyl-tRNA synthetase
MLAPYLPFVTEEIYRQLFRQWETTASIHLTAWPVLHERWIDAEAEEAGQALLEVLRQVRRYKAEQGLSVGAELATLTINVPSKLYSALHAALVDLKSATRAREIILEEYDQELGMSEELSSNQVCSSAALTIDLRL